MDQLPEEVVNAVREHVKEKGLFFDDLSMVVKRASKNGDSFAANVYRVALTVEPDNEKFIVPNDENNTATFHKKLYEFRLIVKVAPTLPFRRDLYNIPVLFDREQYMYTVLLPAFKAFQERIGCAEKFLNYPQLIKSSLTDGCEYIMMDDLLEHGYRNFEKTLGLGISICKEILRGFARFHAISFVFKQKQPEEFEKLANAKQLNETLFVKDMPASLAEFLRCKVDRVLEVLDGVEVAENDDVARDRLAVFREKCTEIMYDACNEKDYAVICHGDSWISNLMFKIDNDLKMDIKFIDWQVSRYTTPVLDLSYFLVCCTDKNLRANFRQLLSFYYESLVGEIEKMGGVGHELYPREVFDRQCQKYMLFGFGMALMTLHCTTCNPEDMPDVISILETQDYSGMEEITKVLSKKPLYIRRMTELIRDMVAFGYL